MSEIGYIGLGEMGAAMLDALLAAERPVTVYDLDADAMASAVERGARAAASVAEVAERCDIVSVCVPAAEHVDVVLHGEHGVRERAHDGLVVLIHSTIEPTAVERARSSAAEWGVAVHDVCVAGGPDQATAGNLVLMVGGLEELDPDVVGLLDIYGSEIIGAGPVGAGAALKIAVNVMTYAQQSAAMAAQELLVAAGGDKAALHAAWRHNGQLGVTVEPYLTLIDLPDEFFDDALRATLQGRVAIAHKDLDLALGLGAASPHGASPVVAAIRDHMDVVYRSGP